ncbi:MAG: hypothetical protein MJ233_02480 [Mycoplasmoidaceae bacterium]|nr:hypothetical protein [Mycoplasmoidaceae bacterium]
MNKKRIISIVFNFAIVTASLIGLILAIFDTMALGKSYEEIFKYYTTLSNLFLLITAILMATFNLRAIFKKDKTVPK